MKLPVEEFERIIEYTFQDKRKLQQALTHSSYANERRFEKVHNNERYEFLGDAVLELTTSEFLFLRDKEMPEGDLTKLRASLVCEQTLAICAREMKIGQYIRLGKGEDVTGGRDRDSILSDAVEAVIGAIYLDGGFTSAKEFIEAHILSDIDNKKLFFDSKTILQEMIQGTSAEQLRYELLSEEGPDHDKRFTVAACLSDTYLEQGVGKTKKRAEQEAAYQSILAIRRKENNNSSCEEKA